MSNIRYFIGTDPSQGIVSIFKATSGDNIELVHSTMDKVDTIGEAFLFDNKCKVISKFFNAETLTL